MHRQNTARTEIVVLHGPTVRLRGFTLIEILIAVAIVGIITAIAVPSYSAYVTKTQRTDATIFLIEAAGEQVRYFSEFNVYTDKMTELGYASDSAVVTPDGLYQVSALLDGAVVAATSFTLTATPVAGEAQANDVGCASFTLNATGARGSSSADCW